MNFESLVQNINAVHETLQAQAAHAVNLALTARNWLIGYYIVEFEQHGEDRAAYGEKLLKKLESRIIGKGMNERRFRDFRRLYLTYPQLAVPVVSYVATNIMTKAEIVNEVAKATGVEKVTVQTVVEAFMENVKESIVKGEPVYLRGFGSFIVKHRAKKAARNITKKTTMTIPAHDIPAFKPAKVFVNAVKEK
jgi:nucleoid DNA-binding protein